MEEFQVECVGVDGDVSFRNIPIRKINGTMAIDLFERRAALLCNVMKDEIELLRERIEDTKELCDHLTVSTPEIDKNGKTFSGLVSEYASLSAALAGKERELKKVRSGLRSMDDVGSSHVKPAESMSAYISIATEICCTYLVVELVTGHGFTESSVFADVDIDSFYLLCERIREVNSRFLEHSFRRK